MAAPIGFDAYFAGRPALTGAQPSTGDSILVLRGGTVFEGNLTWNYAFSYMDNNVTETALTVLDQWESIGGTLIQGVTAASFGFATNIYTYNGPNQQKAANIAASFSISKAGAGLQTFEVSLFVNGVLYGNGMAFNVDDTGIVNVNLTTMYQLQTTDTLELKVRARTSAENVLIQDLQWTISQ